MLNHGWVYRDEILLKDAGLTILDYYCQNYHHSSRQEWSDRLTRGQITLDNQRATTNQILRHNQCLAYHRPPWEEPDVPLDYGILHQDTDFLIISKPSGLPVLPGGQFLENTLLYHLRQHFPNAPPVPIHRLGRGTSGLMIMGRSPHGRKQLSQQLRQHRIKKIYRALIPAGDYPDHLTICEKIGRIPHPLLGTIHAATPTGKFAQSTMRVIQRSADTSIVEMDILTGRPHQIRIHLAAIGYPLVGDPLYGVGGQPIMPDNPAETALPGDCGYYLHAHTLKFCHPRTQAKLTFQAVAPAILQTSHAAERANLSSISGNTQNRTKGCRLG